MNRIKQVLEEKGIKQTWLAKKLGKSIPILNNYVQNRTQPSITVLCDIAKILNVGVTKLLEETSFKPELTFYESLTPKEYEVLEHIKDGLIQPEIMAKMKITKGTLASYRRDLFSKLNAKTAGRAIHVAKELGLI